MKVTLWSGATYKPKVIYFHRHLFWNFAVFDGGLMHVPVTLIKKIEYEPEEKLCHGN